MDYKKYKDIVYQIIGASMEVHDGHSSLTICD